VNVVSLVYLSRLAFSTTCFLGVIITWSSATFFNFLQGSLQASQALLWLVLLLYYSLGSGATPRIAINQAMGDMLILFFLALLAKSCLSDLHVFYEGWSPRILQNTSLGLDHTESVAHQCSATGERRFTSSDPASASLLNYTPNRRPQQETLEDSINEKLQLAFVLALGAHQDGVYNYGEGGSMNGLLSVWDSWVENFFAVTSNTTSLILVLDERDFNKQNHTRSKARYMDILAIDNLGGTPVRCINHRNRTRKGFTGGNGLRNNVFHSGVSSFRKQVRLDHNHGINRIDPNAGDNGGNNHHRHSACGNVLHLDSVYQVYSIDMSPYTNKTNQAPLLVFVTVYAFPIPEWAQDQDEDTLYIHWRPRGLPPRFSTNYGYTKMTNWYAYHMLNLRILGTSSLLLLLIFILVVIMTITFTVQVLTLLFLFSLLLLLLGTLPIWCIYRLLRLCWQIRQ
jgi:hypothetical protein